MIFEALASDGPALALTAGVEGAVVAALSFPLRLKPLHAILASIAINCVTQPLLWIVMSSALYVVIVACWVAALYTEMRIRNLTRDAALAGVPLSAAYRRLFRIWCAFAGPLLIGMIAVFALMIWQPRLDN